MPMHANVVADPLATRQRLPFPRPARRRRPDDWAHCDEAFDLPITKGLQECIRGFRDVDEEIELKPILDKLRARSPLDLAYSSTGTTRSTMRAWVIAAYANPESGGQRP